MLSSSIVSPGCVSDRHVPKRLIKCLGCGDFILLTSRVIGGLAYLPSILGAASKFSKWTIVAFYYSC